MTDYQHNPEQAHVRGLLRAVRETIGRDVAPEWTKAAEAAPRHCFLPELIWLDDDGGGYRPCDRRSGPDRWLAAAYDDEPVVTQLNDGTVPDDLADAWPSSSSSAPSVVFRMLQMLDLQPGMKVLEIGTGTGWTSALLSHRLGDSNVTTIELDPALAVRARVVLKEAGFGPEVVWGDGALGWSRNTPYDRVVATCAVQKIPPAWVDQTRPGGTILTPWDNPWAHWGLLHLLVGDDGTAVGWYSPDSAFMLMRTQRTHLGIYRDVVKDDHRSAKSETTLPRRAVVEGDAAFAIGHRLGDVWHTWEDAPVYGVADRLWIATTDAASWAAVDHDGSEEDRFTVYQHGPRRLWDEVEAAYEWWRGSGKPHPGRLGLTVTPEGGHWAWLDEPSERWLLR
ncbi:methyltransferase [Kitasatospora sp. RG8]|uniref:rRNA adenine N-6-methyltransferase family protein n=1 Tax=Kitasatospora sp. RG8 TaxID=2820815 RepID=UPI001AE0B2BF|nr:rRNA adenine N-6-methyltransferase family protein [Kitasatospora sp. RG8]MBP0448622.1 methyltransferase [Kitasatospora sp. RG8]